MKCSKCRFMKFCKNADNVELFLEQAAEYKNIYRIPDDITLDVVCPFFEEEGGAT